MIEFYRPADCDSCEEIEAALQEMVVAYKVIIVKSGQRPDLLPTNTPLPALQDNGQIISGRTALMAYLRELEEIVADWRRFQSDACYIDDEGEVC
jgi:glutaredoxin